MKAKILALTAVALCTLASTALAQTVTQTIPSSPDRRDTRSLDLGVMTFEVAHDEPQFVEEPVTEHYSERVCAPDTFHSEERCGMETVWETVRTTRRECHTEHDCGYRMLPRFGCETHFGHPMECGVHTESRWACDTFGHEVCREVPDTRRESHSERVCHNESVRTPGACHDEPRSRVVTRRRAVAPLRVVDGTVSRHVVVVVPASAQEPMVTQRERLTLALSAENMDAPINALVSVVSRDRTYNIDHVETAPSADGGMLIIHLGIEGSCERSAGCTSALNTSDARLVTL